ncbi:Hypothetical protein R9X50_00257200 [Acrodontium crateriforme]|uniref:Uncharacterized protein n=1 Tax=Acrodontium crateriforme TaxID=150365 RepID=A0AAQ3M1H8_9PEZI|nr:Hypothetical protein R9X50_00257200 [Acrodontium crateriforme]
MSPPYFDSKVNGWIAFGTGLAAAQAQPMKWYDSLFEDTSPDARSESTVADSVSHNATPDGVPDLQAMHTDHRPRLESQDNGNLRFFVVDHPDKLRDREQMRQNRKHVMQDYLVKERQKPSSADLRANGSMHDGRQMRRRSRPTRAPNPAVKSKPTSEDVSNSNTTLTGEDNSLSLVRRHTKKRPPSEGDELHDRPQVSRRKTEDSVCNGSLYSFAPENALVFPFDFSSNFLTPYLRANLHDVPFVLNRFGGGLNPFHTWPTFSDSAVDVAALKLKCSQSFGSKGLAEFWVPSLLTSRPAFLSTLCISSAHDDIMSRSSRPTQDQRSTESFERIRVRAEVIQMITKIMKDPELQTADTTIIAVLQLLNSEIMGCEETTMQWHQHGLHEMVRQRGGLDQLGLHGKLASILTITMYLIAALRETTPHVDFQAHAKKQQRRPSQDRKPFPKSPFVGSPMRPTSDNKESPSTEKTLELLDILRRITDAFLSQHPSSSNPHVNGLRCTSNARDAAESVSVMKNKIFAFNTAESYVFSDVNQKHRFEAIRLTSLIYAFALDNEVPLSTAAAILRQATPSPCGENGDCASHIRAKSDTSSMSLSFQIKSNLMRTDLSGCWGAMSGVLFWITLVAGAAANPEASEHQQREPEGYEEEEARKWLAAVAVRCEILLSFDFGQSILSTLKKMVGIQQTLARRSAARSGSGGSERGSVSARVHGPVEAQKGFGDFVHDFLD